jgi:hypothetical protein
LAKSAIDVIGTAFEHTQQQLIRPFRFGQWARLALLALATGELTSGGGCGRMGNFTSRLPRGSNSFVDPGDVLRGIDPALFVSLLLFVAVAGLVLMLVWIYISSISRFILFESVLTKRCDSLSDGWSRWQGPGTSFFWWQLGIFIVSVTVAAVLFLPLLLPVLATLKNHQQPGAGWMLALLPMFVVFGIFALLMLLIAVLAKDFVVPLMAIDGIGVLEAWRRLLAMMKAEKGSYAGYVGMKAVLAIGASVVFGILSAIAAFFLLIPVVIVGVIVVIAGKGAGLSWNALTITAAIVVGSILFVVLMYVIALVCVPIAVFFPAYAMYFLAGRFPALHARLYPPPLPPAAAPPLPSAWVPPPEPIG